jgi:lipopolysaccharide/colanic/teichoic acid biosynthesis glycosyltransferase
MTAAAEFMRNSPQRRGGEDSFRLVEHMIGTPPSATTDPVRQMAAPPGPAPSGEMLRPPAGWYALGKPVLEFAVALVLLVFTTPIVLLAALLVKLTSRGPAFYVQTRLGKNGKPYAIYKLRTMVHNAEFFSGPRWSTAHDPRVTPLGRFLRDSHIDEFPQLLNVLRGEMSLVGPRPERPEFVPQLEKAIPRYRDRLLVRPGITGLAQIQLAADTDLTSVRRKLLYDLHYIRRMNPWLDLAIVLATAGKMLAIPFGFFRRVLRIPGPAEIEPAEEPSPPAG